MITNEPLDQDEAFALDAYAALPRSQPPPEVDARIRAAAHAINATRRPRRWTSGLATAAVAVLAVGVAWRGLETERPDYAPAPVPQTVPTMQPAFKLETPAAAAKEREGSRDDARAGAAVPETSTAPSMSSADWESPESGRRSPPRAVKAKPLSPPPEPKPADVPVFDEPLPMAAPSPAPPAPPAPLVEAFPEPILQEERPSEPTEQPSQSDSAVDVSSPARPALGVVGNTSSQAAEAVESEAVESRVRGADRQEQDLGKLSSAPSAPAAASAGSASPFVPEPDAAKREQSGAAFAKSVHHDRLNSASAVSAQSIRAGNTSFVDAVAATRAAHARGDVTTARALAAAIVARYGQQRLPRDLRDLTR